MNRAARASAVLDTARLLPPAQEVPPAQPVVADDAVVDEDFVGPLCTVLIVERLRCRTRGRAVTIALPERNKDAPTVNQDGFQEPQKIPQGSMASVEPAESPTGRSAADGWNCGEVNTKTEIQPCSRLMPDASKTTRDALTMGVNADSPHLVDWCET